MIIKLIQKSNRWVQIRGTRVAVKTLFDYLEDSSLEEFLAGFPSVSREQAEAVIEQAAAKFLSEAAA